MKKEASTESASLDPAPARPLPAKGGPAPSGGVDRKRMAKYKRFAAAFSYPDGAEEKLISEYDGLFRAGQLWLYGTEHIAKNEFQRSNLLSDIMAFYKAFGVEPHKDRPDSLASELEFMYYLIFKELHAADGKDAQERASVCYEAQKKFFAEHLYPASKKIAHTITSRVKEEGHFYRRKAEELLEFLESEKRLFGERG